MFHLKEEDIVSVSFDKTRKRNQFLKALESINPFGLSVSALKDMIYSRYIIKEWKVFQAEKEIGGIHLDLFHFFTEAIGRDDWFQKSNYSLGFTFVSDIQCDVMNYSALIQEVENLSERFAHNVIFVDCMQDEGIRAIWVEQGYRHMLHPKTGKELLFKRIENIEGKYTVKMTENGEFLDVFRFGDYSSVFYQQQDRALEIRLSRTLVMDMGLSKSEVCNRLRKDILTIVPLLQPYQYTILVLDSQHQQEFLNQSYVNEWRNYVKYQRMGRKVRIDQLNYDDPTKEAYTPK